MKYHLPGQTISFKNAAGVLQYRVKVMEYAGEAPECKECCFSKAMSHNFTCKTVGYECAISVKIPTYCHKKDRADGKNVVYKIIKKN